MLETYYMAFVHTVLAICSVISAAGSMGATWVGMARWWARDKSSEVDVEAGHTCGCRPCIQNIEVCIIIKYIILLCHC